MHSGVTGVVFLALLGVLFLPRLRVSGRTETVGKKVGIWEGSRDTKLLVGGNRAVESTSGFTLVREGEDN
jgi:hypothetical protein